MRARRTQQPPGRPGRAGRANRYPAVGTPAPTGPGARSRPRGHQVRPREVVRQIENMGRRGLAVQANGADPAANELLVHRVAQGLGGLDILVNNAGTIREGWLASSGRPTSPSTWCSRGPSIPH
ncbi:SDR family NAD(P)-dependent oxidoreductase [Promicromonospora sp. NPDC090134]|uniref:SDR family NAD(P)-dependent oxidoreductase n=1 Tax=Promicromonospora sp. NPDC090134 TaxID=3364408 RepID=UPI003801D766